MGQARIDTNLFIYYYIARNSCSVDILLQYHKISQINCAAAKNAVDGT